MIKKLFIWFESLDAQEWCVVGLIVSLAILVFSLVAGIWNIGDPDPTYIPAKTAGSALVFAIIFGLMIPLFD
jgi:hypothetical protein